MAFRSGKRTFGEYLKLLARAREFRVWIQGLSPSADLLKEYHRSIAEKSFVEQLPAKWIRYFVFTGGGVAIDHAIGGALGVSAALGLGLADAFLVEKLGLGWKPHHFVTGEMRGYVLGEGC
ncbi:MAG: hypothetical protein JNJ55_10590 [Betaproteobacteria bacterium]|nr:hypothetical protein [Betaproteobacteria bacterium]